MKTSRSERALRAACVLAILAIGLMVWSLFDPRPAPVVLAMSLGQVLGTVSLATFVAVVVLDLRARLAARARPSGG